MRVAWHIIFWVLIWVWMTTVYIYDDTDFLPYLVFNLTRLPAIIITTYSVNYLVVYKRLAISSPKYGESTAIFLTLFVLATLADRAVSGLDAFSPTLHGQPLHYYFLNPFPLLKNAFILLSIIGLAASVQFFIYTYKQQKEIHQLKEEKLESQLSFLRSQINPHFLFNAFNNLYSIASRNQQRELAQGLAGMAGLMRYLTYESNIPQILLVKEVELIKSFIELQRLRIPDDNEAIIDFQCEGDFNSYYIAPVLLLPLVENAFKYSFSSSESTLITLRLNLREGQLTLLTSNKVHEQENTNENAKGIGLENLRRRLQIIYPNQHSLNLQNENGYFTATLTIDLSHQSLKL